MILVIYAEVWTWNRSTPLNCYNTSKVSQTADNHKGQIHHHQIHFFFIFNIKTIIKISYIIFMIIYVGPMTAVTAFVEGWDFVQTLGEGAYGE